MMLQLVAYHIQKGNTFDDFQHDRKTDSPCFIRGTFSKVAIFTIFLGVEIKGRFNYFTRDDSDITYNSTHQQ